ESPCWMRSGSNPPRVLPAGARHERAARLLPHSATEEPTMKKPHCLVSIAVTVAALAVGGSARAASDCLQLGLSSPGTLCSGQSTAITATIGNSCPDRDRVSATVSLDERTLPLNASFSVPGNATLTKQINVPVPASAQPGSHPLTVTVSDAAGNEASASIDLNVASCAAK